MKILIPIKRVIDYNVRVQVRPDGRGVVTDGVKMDINPFDEIAVEEALRIKEAGKAEEVIVATIGTAAAQEQLRKALAMGADRAIFVQADSEIQPLYAAKILKAITEQESPQLIILGKQAIDDDFNQTGQMLAGLLDWPQATFASKIELTDKTATVTREVDTGLETIEIDLPAVVTTDLRLNEPRHIKLQNIMKAKQKPMQIFKLEDLGITPPKQLETLKVEPPPKRMAGIKVEDAAALVVALKERGLC